MKISKELSNTLLLANFYCTILVVSIHYNSLYHYDQPEPTDIFYLLQTYINISLTRIAVPFFALTSGFFLFLKFEPTIENYKTAVNKRTHTLLVPYLTVAIIVFAFNRLVDYSKSLPVDYSAIALLKTIITPETIQLWYIRDLLFLVAASPIIFLFCKKAAHVYIPIISVMWISDYQPFPMLGDWHLITIEALYFFSLGCIASLKVDNVNAWYHSVSPTTFYLIFWVYLLITLFRVYLTLNSVGNEDSWQHTFSLMLHKLSIIIGLLAIILACRIRQPEIIARLATYTFFVYLYHLLPLSKFILLFWNDIISEKNLFYVTTPSALIASFMLAHLLKTRTPKLYYYLTGGR